MKNDQTKEAHKTEAARAYEGKPDWRESITLPDGSTYPGTPRNWPQSIPMPDGSTYSGTPGNWRTSIPLITDEGEDQ